jgi:very-short-patch-repair endonuclease
MARDQALEKAGYRVLRFWNNQVDREMEGVLETILDALSTAHHPTRRVTNPDTPPNPQREG